jgi:phospholipase D3/4
VIDGCHLYLGSANMDWRSLTQVKELGVIVEDSTALAADATKYFEAWWTFAAAKVETATAFDGAARIWRRVPAWSELIPAEDRRPSPLDDERYATVHNQETPLQVEIDGRPAGVFLSGCPLEVRGRGRTYDGAALSHTILDARRSVCVSVMDFAPVSLYDRKGDAELAQREDPAPLDAPVWWPDLFDALLHAVLTRRVWARLLVSKWAHSSRLIEPYLRALQRAADAGRADHRQTGGLLEIKYFIVPGWDATTGPGRKYAGFSRVNHAKYIVTDRRINVGTSNMTWDYFANTAGSSFNTDHPGLVGDLQAIFDRDWTSRYASPLAVHDGGSAGSADSAGSAPKPPLA